MEWPEKARRRVEELRLTYREVEERAGWAPNTLRTALSEGTNVGVSKAISLAKALTVSADWLFDESKGWEDRRESDADSGKGHLQRALRTLLLSFGCANVGVNVVQRGFQQYVSLMTVLQEAIERLQNMDAAVPEAVDRIIDGVRSAVQFIETLEPYESKINTAHLLRALDSGKLNFDQPEELLVNSDQASTSAPMFPEERRAPYHYRNTLAIEPADLILLDEETLVTVAVVQPNPVIWQGQRFERGARFEIPYAQVLPAIQAGQVNVVAAQGVEVTGRSTVEVRVIIDGYLWDAASFTVGDRIQSPYYPMVEAIRARQVILAAIPQK